VWLIGKEVLKRKSEPKVQEVTEEQRKLLDEELHIYPSSGVSRTNKIKNYRQKIKPK
jgi:hypothetical protein